MTDYETQRARLVDSLEKRLFERDERVFRALRKVPRHLFTPTTLWSLAYEDRALPIGDCQTISAPHMVAIMTSLLRVQPHHKVFEVGTGSGYQAAVLAELAAEVYTIERVPDLAERAAATLSELGINNVCVVVGDGCLGYPEAAPYDRIIVTAAGADVSRSLIDQLASPGRLLMPVGSHYEQELVALDKSDDVLRRSYHGLCYFVPLIGEGAWNPPQER
jgi:protein-L-isoaspartate(D-aspartate) O-methyltransferase